MSWIRWSLTCDGLADWLCPWTGGSNDKYLPRIRCRRMRTRERLGRYLPATSKGIPIHVSDYKVPIYRPTYQVSYHQTRTLHHQGIICQKPPARAAGAYEHAYEHTGKDSPGPLADARSQKRSRVSAPSARLLQENRASTPGCANHSRPVSLVLIFSQSVLVLLLLRVSLVC